MKKEKKKTSKWRNALVYLLGGIMPEKIDSSLNTSMDELDQIYLFDFQAGWIQSGFNQVIIPQTIMLEDGTTARTTGNIQEQVEKAKEEAKIIKIKIKPKDVLHELEVIPTPFSLELLDEKLAILKDKEKMIKQHYTKREVTALIERLENRKKYKEFASFFDTFQNTNQEKIDALIQKYSADLTMETSDLFIPEFPDDAIKIMKDYTDNVEKICGKKPVFYVIAEKTDFRSKQEKRDPILLVQSPFGFYYQILGAWDKELILLSEL